MECYWWRLLFCEKDACFFYNIDWTYVIHASNNIQIKSRWEVFMVVLILWKIELLLFSLLIFRSQGIKPRSRAFCVSPLTVTQPTQQACNVMSTPNKRLLWVVPLSCLPTVLDTSDIVFNIIFNVEMTHWACCGGSLIIICQIIRCQLLIKRTLVYRSIMEITVDP